MRLTWNFDQLLTIKLKFAWYVKRVTSTRHNVLRRHFGIFIQFFQDLSNFNRYLHLWMALQWIQPDELSNKYQFYFSEWKLILRTISMQNINWDQNVIQELDVVR